MRNFNTLVRAKAGDIVQKWIDFSCCINPSHQKNNGQALAMNSEINIVNAERAREYRLRIVFADGSVKEVDFKPFLIESCHPVVRSFLHPEKFVDFRVEYGDLIWGDYDLCFPVVDLYDNQIMPKHTERLAA